MIFLFEYKDIYKLMCLYVFTVIFSYFIKGNYTIKEVVFNLIIVTVAYVFASIFKNKKKK